MGELSVGLLYLSLHNQLVKKFGVDAEISRKEFFIKIAKHGQIPRELREFVLKEMEKKNLIKRLNRDKLKLLPLNFDLENKESYKKFINKIGIY